MIELNLTYEESKKILELGYDFSPICATFSASGKTSSHGLPFATMIINPSLKGVGHLENLNHLKSLPYMRLDKEINIDSITPIIPKAALEACLPGGLLVDICCLSTDFRKIFSTPYSKESIELFWDGHSMEADTIIHKSCSIFEMFLWLHENYPEELKRKFDEVMA